MKLLLVTNEPEAWQFLSDNITIIDAYSYLNDPEYINGDQSHITRVINLCDNYEYQSLGYYVSLLAQARGHKVIPTPLTIEDMNRPQAASILYDTIEDDVAQALKRIKGNEFKLSLYFSKNIASSYDELCRKIYGLLPMPLFRVYFKFDKEWYIKRIKPVNIHDVPESHREFLKEAALKYFSKKRFRDPKNTARLYDVAILSCKNEHHSPSNEKAIQKFIEAGEAIGLGVSVISRDDIKILPQYDALFIRETTAVNHFTYQFSRRAFAENLVVVDDPTSILKCSNKVYLSEMLKKHDIPAPKTTIITKHNLEVVSHVLEYPQVLKRPDGAFSLGIVKVDNHIDFVEEGLKLLEGSELIVAQEFMPTEYDWRIGVLDNKPLFATRYHMAEGHWQIYNWEGKTKSEQEGDDTPVPLEDVPKPVLKSALAAAKLIGDGLYGVDVKQVKNKAYIIEVNDNPNIDHGVEDRLLKDELYMTIMQYFLDKIKRKHSNA